MLLRSKFDDSGAHSKPATGVQVDLPNPRLSEKGTVGASQVPKNTAAFDGFDFDVIPGQSTVVHSGLRPREVALLTLRNDTEGVGTTLYDEDDEATDTCALTGELLRFDNGLGAPPTVLPVGCFGNYSKLQISSTGRLYLLASSGGLSFQLGQSDDLGESWAFHTVPVQGLGSTPDVQFFDPTPVSPHSSPLAHDPDSFVFLFSGYDQNSLARHTYFGSIPLQ